MTTATHSSLPKGPHQRQLLLDSLCLVDFAATNVPKLTEQINAALTDAHDFLNTLDAQEEPSEAAVALTQIQDFEDSGRALQRHWGVLSHLNSVVSDADIRAAHHHLLPKLSAYTTRVGQHPKLYANYRCVRDNNDFLQRQPQARQRAIELAIRQFEQSGVALPRQQQAQFAALVQQLSALSAQFADNVLDATQAFALPLEQDQLAGLPKSSLDLLAAAGEQYQQQRNDDPSTLPTPYYVATLDMPIYLAIMTHADDRALRQTLYHAFVTRASEWDTHTNAQGESLNNADNMTQILQKRAQKAALLGFTDYAQLSLSNKMADSAEQVDDFLTTLAAKATPAAKRDREQLVEYAHTLGYDTLQPWDTAYVAEKIKQTRFCLSQEAIRPYFALPTVIDGLFGIVQRLYGIQIQPADEQATTWHPDVTFYLVYDRNDTLIGGFYFDLFARSGKRGGAWMSGFQSRMHGSHVQQLPVCFMVANFAPPVSDQPSLLTHNEVLTLFHEFGHGLHHLLTQVGVDDVAGVNGVEWDAVELPSQFMENWAWHKEGIDLISAHVDTGEPLPDADLQALLAAKNFQSGLHTLRQIEFALFDLRLHKQNPAPDYAGILATLSTVRAEIALLPTPDYNRFANGFSHIFAGGYAAGYYSYKWAELLSADAFARFEEEGLFNADTGQAFLDTVLTVGGSLPAKTNFERFRGRSASIEALLRHSGFTDPKAA